MCWRFYGHPCHRNPKGGFTGEAVPWCFGVCSFETEFPKPQTHPFRVFWRISLCLIVLMFATGQGFVHNAAT